MAKHQRAPQEPNRESHPSYGVINIHRVSGLRTLFRSQLNHHNWIELTISEAEVIQDLKAYDHVMGRKEIISISMSETQFAKMVSSMNLGCGTPCTITDREGKRIPDPPFQDRAAFVQNGHEKHLEQSEEALSDLAGHLEEMLEAKKRPTLAELRDIQRQIAGFMSMFRANSKYYRERFTEEMETIVEAAKTEIEAHVSRVVEKTGIEAMNLPRLT